MRVYTFFAVTCALFLTSSLSASYVIDFDTLPDGTPTYEGQSIYDEYEEAYGVTFQVLNNATGEPVGFPVVSKVGLPLTAFTGCTGADTPLPGQGLGDSFISFGSCTTKQSLLIDYSNPVSQVSGVLIDTDVWASGSYEQWTIKARDANGTTIAEMIVDPCDLPVPAIECTYGASGRKGDSLGVTCSFDANDKQIYSVIFLYSGTAPSACVAFDNFSPATSAPVLIVSISAKPWNKICPGETVDLVAHPSGGFLPYSFQWQEETTPENWTDLGTEYGESVSPIITTNYRVIVADDQENEVISDSFTLAVCGTTPDLNLDGCINLKDFAIFALDWLNRCDM